MPTETSSAIAGVRIVTLDVYGDLRGRFCEIFRSAAMPETFVQANHSRSAAGQTAGFTVTISNIGGGSRGFQWLVRIYRLAELKQMKDS